MIFPFTISRRLFNLLSKPAGGTDAGEVRSPLYDAGFSISTDSLLILENNCVNLFFIRLMGREPDATLLIVECRPKHRPLFFHGHAYIFRLIFLGYF